jgi:tetratricopeptide (TPR) repeat protein
MENEPPKTTTASPSQIGNKLLAKYSDADGLLLKSPVAPLAESKPQAIPLQRFQELEQAIKHAPANEGPYIELGRIYLEQKRWGDAKRVLDAGVQYCSECEPILLMREDLTLLLASQMLDDAKLKCAQQPTAEHRYELEQAEINMANERIRICNHRFTRRPQEKEILIPWAIALRQLGRHDEAVGLLAQAAEDPALRARASLQLGMCLQHLHRPLEALAALRKAALFRSPPPDPAIRIRALELAAAIAEESLLIDSAIYYAEQLLPVVDTKHRPEWESKIEEWKTRPL